MAWNNDLFHYWHDGLGAEIFAIGASLMILSISLYGAGPRSGERRRGREAASGG
jgi:hypothetical protein